MQFPERPISRYTALALGTGAILAVTALASEVDIAAIQNNQLPLAMVVSLGATGISAYIGYKTWRYMKG